MPVVHVQMLAGRTPQQKRRLIEELTRVMHEVAGAPPDRVHVLVDEVDPDNWGRGGIPMSEHLALEEAADGRG